MQNTPIDSARHQIGLIRHETRRRTLTVAAIEHLTPRMRRVMFTAPDLADFVSAAPDDHVKLFFPAHDTNGRPCMRDFTPRAFDRARGTLTIDFALHAAGPATSWAASVAPGQTIETGGPRGSRVVPPDFDWYLLIGDETALPAIGRWVEELPSGTPVSTIVAITGASEMQNFSTKAAWTPLWAMRDAAAASDAKQLQAALAAHAWPPGEGFVWIAAEAAVARVLRDDVMSGRQHPKAWLKASGYWQQGQAEVHEKLTEN